MELDVSQAPKITVRPNRTKRLTIHYDDVYSYDDFGAEYYITEIRKRLIRWHGRETINVTSHYFIIIVNRCTYIHNIARTTNK